MVEKEHIKNQDSVRSGVANLQRRSELTPEGYAYLMTPGRSSGVQEAVHITIVSKEIHADCLLEYHDSSKKISVVQLEQIEGGGVVFVTKGVIQSSEAMENLREVPRVLMVHGIKQAKISQQAIDEILPHLDVKAPLIDNM
jgi:hypothetical protein